MSNLKYSNTMKKSIYLALCMTTLLCSCEKEKGIGLSQKNVEFGWGADTVVVTTETTSWNVETVEVDNKSYATTTEEIGIKGKTFDWLTVVAEERRITLVSVANPSYQKRKFSIMVRGDAGSEQIVGSQDEMLDGVWDDVIQANPKELTVKAEGETVRVTTKSYWWICTIEAEDEVYHATPEENRLCSGDEMRFEKRVGWLTVNRDGNDVVISVDANDTGRDRTFGVTLGEGDYYCKITGVQQAE